MPNCHGALDWPNYYRWDPTKWIISVYFTYKYEEYSLGATVGSNDLDFFRKNNAEIG